MPVSISESLKWDTLTQQFDWGYHDTNENTFIQKPKPDTLKVHRDSQNTGKRVTPMGEY